MLQSSASGNLLSRISQIKDMLEGKNPDAVFSEMMQNNPDFRKFVESNRGKSPEQIARENGIDPTILR